MQRRQIESLANPQLITRKAVVVDHVVHTSAVPSGERKESVSAPDSVKCPVHWSAASTRPRRGRRHWDRGSDQYWCGQNLRRRAGSYTRRRHHRCRARFFRRDPCRLSWCRRIKGDRRECCHPGRRDEYYHAVLGLKDDWFAGLFLTLQRKDNGAKNG